MKKLFILLIATFLTVDFYSQTTCESGIISNEMWQTGEIAQYVNMFAQSFEVPDCVSHIKGMEVDFVGTYYTGVMRLWSGIPCTGENPQPLAEVNIGTENGIIGIRNSYERFDFSDGNSLGIEIPGPGTYTVTFQMSGVFEGFQYDEQANFIEGEFYYFDLGDWAPYPGADLFFRVYVQSTPTGVEDSSKPVEFSLMQNYPNPFSAKSPNGGGTGNPSTNISFSIPKTSEVSLKVYNALGVEVAELVNENLIAGFHTVNFNTNDFSLSSGVYFYTLKTENFVQTKKMILLK